jgi:2,5-diketo-D-gluconate reductase B
MELMSDESPRQVRVQGDEVPAMGLGTWALDGSECVEAVVDALSLGYRLLDTAQAYGNEAEVGTGIRRAGVDRRDVWVTTKVAWDNLGYDACVASVRQSLDRLETDWIDLLLIHWPRTDQPLEETLGAMGRLQDEGAVRRIGVSNFTPSLLREALEIAPVFCNQVEYHPFLAQDELLELARSHDILLTAYSPLARGRVVEDETLRSIGEEHGKSAAQVALRWLLQQTGVGAIPKAADAKHRRENFEVFDFSLSDDEMTRISALDQGLRLIDPQHAPSWERAEA